MSIPSTINIEYPISSLGSESSPCGVVIGSTFWTVFSYFGNLYLKEYEGALSGRLRINVSHFSISPALNSDNSLNPSRFWLWETTPNNVLNLVEVEPHIGSGPTIVSVTQLRTGVLWAAAVVTADQYVKVFCLNNTLPSTLSMLVYQDIKSAVIDYTLSDLYWNTTRLEDLSADIVTSPSRLLVSSLDVASPPNVKEDVYTFDSPQITTIEQEPGVVASHLIWSIIPGVDTYVLERSKEDPLFLTPTEVYRGALVELVDPISEPNATYYYRVKARLNDADMESDWSTARDVFIFSIIVCDFSGTPTSGNIPLVAQFTDLSTGSIMTSWAWDFGDGSSLSDLQNPRHYYMHPGTYTVSLTVSDGFAFGSKTVIGYIVVPPVTIDFIGSPIKGTPPMWVHFSDISVGVNTTSWYWEFGDGTHNSDRNPEHVYRRNGAHTVSLTVTVEL